MNLTSGNYDSVESPSQVLDDPSPFEYSDRTKNSLPEIKEMETPYLEPVSYTEKPLSTYRKKTYKEKLKEDFEKRIKKKWRKKNLRRNQNFKQQNRFSYNLRNKSDKNKEGYGWSY